MKMTDRNHFHMPSLYISGQSENLVQCKYSDDCPAAAILLFNC